LITNQRPGLIEGPLTTANRRVKPTPRQRYSHLFNSLSAWKITQDLPGYRLFLIISMPCFTTPKRLHDTCQIASRDDGLQEKYLSPCL